LVFPFFVCSGPRGPECTYTCEGVRPSVVENSMMRLIFRSIGVMLAGRLLLYAPTVVLVFLNLFTMFGGVILIDTLICIHRAVS